MSSKDALLKGCLLFLLGTAFTLGACADRDDGNKTQEDPLDSDAPALIRAEPSVGSPEGGQRVALFGRNLGEIEALYFGTEKGLHPLLVNAQQINVTSPSHEPGLVDLSLKLKNGEALVLKDGFLYLGPLALDSISPASDLYVGGQEVDVLGKGFTQKTRILIGGRMLEEQEWLDDGHIRGKVPARLSIESPLASVYASNGFEQRVLKHGFRYERTLSLEGLTPVSGPTQGGTRVLLEGEGLHEDKVVLFGERPGELLGEEEGRAPGRFLWVKAPPQEEGLYDLTIMDQDGGNRVRLEKAFYYLDEDDAAGASLELHHLLPAIGEKEGGNKVRISVKGLQSLDDVNVSFAGKTATLVREESTLQSLTVYAPSGTVGQAQVLVFEGLRRSEGKVYDYVNTPVLRGLDPPFGPLSGAEVRLFGEALGREAKVYFGGKEATWIGGEGREMKLRLPPSVPGRVDVKLVLGPYQSELSAAYEYRSETSQLWAVSPEELAQAGGQVLRFYGEGFQKLETPSLRLQDDLEIEDVFVLDDHLMIGRMPKDTLGKKSLHASFGNLAMALEVIDPKQPLGGTKGGPLTEGLNVTVLERRTRRPVSGASVILWSDWDGPYQGQTDEKGQLTFSELYFDGPQMVTATKDDFSTFTILDFEARDVTLSLIALQPPELGDEEDQGPVTPFPDGTLSGKVTGVGKYILTPPGDCDARLSSENGSLCESCKHDGDCGDGGSCLPLGKEGYRCSFACEEDSDCPETYRCGLLQEGLQCVPEPGKKRAYCQVTQRSAFSPPRGQVVVLEEDGDYQITTRPGDYAVVCMGGAEDRVTRVFSPMVMGVKRHVTVRPGERISAQDVALDIPLTRDLRVRLDGVPMKPKEVERHTLSLYLDFGSDGVFPMPQLASALQSELFQLEGFPEALTGDLYDASFIAYAAATEDKPPSEQSGLGSFVLHDQIRDFRQDALFRVEGKDAIPMEAAQKGGFNAISASLSGDSAFAVGESGRVLRWSRGAWQIQQIPGSMKLLDVWLAKDGSEALTVGERGAVFYWNGDFWAEISSPEALGPLDWWKVEGDGAGGFWLLGEGGLFYLDQDFHFQRIQLPESSTQFQSMSLFEESLWLAGEGSEVLRYREGGFQHFSVPLGHYRAFDFLRPDQAFLVGDGGSILSWDGGAWFAHPSVSQRKLYDVMWLSEEEAYALGDAGELLKWNGLSWRRLENGQAFAAQPTAFLDGADLRGLAMVDGSLHLVGLPALILGPFMAFPELVSPDPSGTLSGRRLQWQREPSFQPSFFWGHMVHASGFPYWSFVANGRASELQLPDLRRAGFNVMPLWPGLGFLQLVSVYRPGFSMDRWDESILTPTVWRSWAVNEVPLLID